MGLIGYCIHLYEYAFRYETGDYTRSDRKAIFELRDVYIFDSLKIVGVLHIDHHFHNIVQGSSGFSKHSLQVPESLFGLLLLEQQFSAGQQLCSVKWLGDEVVSARGQRFFLATVIIFSAGVGSPYFTTDTAGELRALEINADVILKATKVDGVYSADPMIDKSAEKFNTIRYMEVLKKGLKVMDSTAIALCKDHDLPIIVFNLFKKGNIKKAVLGHKVGTTVY